MLWSSESQDINHDHQNPTKGIVWKNGGRTSSTVARLVANQYLTQTLYDEFPLMHIQCTHIVLCSVFFFFVIVINFPDNMPFSMTFQPTNICKVI